MSAKTTAQQRKAPSRRAACARSMAVAGAAGAETDGRASDIGDLLVGIERVQRRASCAVPQLYPVGQILLSRHQSCGRQHALERSRVLTKPGSGRLHEGFLVYSEKCSARLSPFCKEGRVGYAHDHNGERATVLTVKW